MIASIRHVQGQKQSPRTRQTEQTVRSCFPPEIHCSQAKSPAPNKTQKLPPAPRTFGQFPLHDDKEPKTIHGRQGRGNTASITEELSPELHRDAPGDRRQRKAGGADRDRTGDLKLAKLALSQLSYGPVCIDAHDRRPAQRVVGLGRLELPTSRLSSARSNQLSYRPLFPGLAIAPQHQPSVRGPLGRPRGP